MITSAHITLSIIIPTLNEAATIERLLERLRAEADCELIVVDGGSRDQTVALAKQADKVLQSSPGRGSQMNAGAEVARGEFLLFLHADCWPEPGFTAKIHTALLDTDVVAGGFRQAIDHSSFKYRLLEYGNAFRASTLGWIYGDQGLFLSKATYDAVGGFPDLPLMEDLEFSKTLKRRGRLMLLDHPLHVDPRRWEQRGVVRQTIRNWMFVLLWHLGVSAERLARWYRNIR